MISQEPAHETATGDVMDVVARRWAAWRLGALSAAVSVLAVVSLAFSPVSRDDVAAVVEPFGPLAPAVFVVVAAVLGMVFVPGPLLAAVSGSIFGLWVGFTVSVLSGLLSAVLTLLVGRWIGRDPLDRLSGERVEALVSLARRRGFAVVLLQRWIPGIPDPPFSYLFGVLGVGLPAIAAGTVLGAAPRAFAYVALGDAAVTGNGRLAVLAVGIGVVISGIGALAGVVVVRRHRAAQRSG